MATKIVASGGVILPTPFNIVRAKQMFCHEAPTLAAFQRMRTFEDTNSVFIVLSYYHSFRLLSR